MTSPCEQIQIHCVRCGSFYEDWMRSSINSWVTPELAADRDYVHGATTTTCPTCGLHLSIDQLVFREIAWSLDPVEHDAYAIYPRDLTTTEQRDRFDVALAAARQLFGEDGEDAVRMAAGSIYRSDIEIDGPGA